VLSHDTSGCSCIVVALPPPSDAVPACCCVLTPVVRAAVCLLYVSAVKRRRVAVLHACHSRQSLAVCSCSVVVVVWRALVCTYMASLCVALRRVRASHCRCVVELDDGVRYLWAVWLSFFGVTHTRCCASAIACGVLTGFQAQLT
jgi:hypothetical protein